jgi:hypothetical protein
VFGVRYEKPAEAAPPAAKVNVSAELYRDKPAVSRMDVLEWVGGNLANDALVPPDAPSALAWCMREWAAKDGTSFWREVIRAFVKAADSDVTEGQVKSHAQQMSADCERKLQRLQEVARG